MIATDLLAEGAGTYIERTHPDLANPLQIPDNYDSQVDFLSLLARLDIYHQIGRDMADIGVDVLAPRCSTEEEEAERAAIWLDLRDAVRAGNPDDIKRLARDLLGAPPVTITYTGTDASGTERAETIDVADPDGWIRRRHDQGWTTLTVTRDDTEIGGIIHDTGTGESTVWFEGGDRS